MISIYMILPCFSTSSPMFYSVLKYWT